jgi:murein DD-endopeptidase MepM/ murein hydrolase activator NlpD
MHWRGAGGRLIDPLRRSRRLDRLRARSRPLRLLARRLPGWRSRFERRMNNRLGDPAEIAAREEEMIARVRALEPPSRGPEATSIAWSWPTTGQVRSGFGVRVGRMHYGVDIAAPQGQPVAAAAAGQVRSCLELADYGLTTVISHAPGMMTIYGHQRDVVVTPGQQVRTGETIGHVGSTGRSTGPHLHFEVRERGIARDPSEFLPAIGPEPRVSPSVGTGSPNTEAPASTGASDVPL